MICSFCGKSPSEVRKLIPGPGVYICEACVMVCAKLVEKHVDPYPSGTFTIDDREVECPHCRSHEFSGATTRLLAAVISGPFAGQEIITVLTCNRCGSLQQFAGSHSPIRKPDED